MSEYISYEEIRTLMDIVALLDPENHPDKNKVWTDKSKAMIYKAKQLTSKQQTVRVIP